ncbi:Hypothetical predicted protein [Paramuricea clavata]|uniref:Uncharacterized protein n=1 Tax=Paramuricea clavata TaxID=317549 RepID=A0A6S7G4X1_PARCT|nr:Hypothetical predicted protein [Paramuricea clavata]
MKRVLTAERRSVLMNRDDVRDRYLSAQVEYSKKYFALHPKARENASRYVFEPTIDYDGNVDGVDIYIIVGGKRHYVGDESYTRGDAPELKVKHTKAVSDILSADHYVKIKPELKAKHTKVVSDTLNTDHHVETKQELDKWPKIWDSGGTVPPFTNLRETKHEWGIHHYPVFQKAVNLGYPQHNFKVYVSDTDYFYSKFNPIKLYDWKNKAVLYENNRGTDELPSDVESDIRNVSMDYENEPYFAQICSAYIAIFLCGISLDNLKWDDNTPKQITSIVWYHLYYTMKKFIKNPSLMKAYDISGMKGHLRISIQAFNGASHGGGTYVKIGWANNS